MTGDFVTGQFFFDSRSAPPFGLEQRLTSTLLDDPWGAVGRTNPYPVAVGGADYPYNAALYSLFISMPYDIKTTRNHSWNVAFQRQVGDNMAFSATYLGNHMVNMWGVVDGNPGVIPAGATPTGPCTLKLPAGGTQTFANCSTAPLDLRRELSQLNPAVGQYYGYLDWITDAGWQNYHGLMLQFQRRSAGGIATSANYTDLDVRRPDQPGPGAAQRRHRVHEARVADQSALGRRSAGDLRRGQGAVRHVAQAHLQPECERRDAAVQQRGGACARIRLAALGDLPCEFR